MARPGPAGAQAPLARGARRLPLRLLGLFAGVTGLAVGIPLYRQWGQMAVGPYALAAVIMAVVAWRGQGGGRPGPGPQGGGTAAAGGRPGWSPS